jgi:ATP-dependent DNA helicase DinG
VFVMLDRQMPSRLLSAFPAGAPVIKSGLSEALRGIGNFLKS